jgi:hypothetical protein
MFKLTSQSNESNKRDGTQTLGRRMKGATEGRERQEGNHLTQQEKEQQISLPSWNCFTQ